MAVCRLTGAHPERWRRTSNRDHVEGTAGQCRLEFVSAKYVAHGLIGNDVAEIGQGSDDAVVPPAGVFSGATDNERFQFGRDAGPARGVRNLEPSNLRAMSRRSQARMVSGLATQATC